MAKYLINRPAFLNLGKDANGRVVSQYFNADAAGAVIEIPDDVAPSRLWEPLDKAALSVFKRYGVEKTLAKPPETPKPDDVSNDGETMAAVARRTVDRSPV